MKRLSSHIAILSAFSLLSFATQAQKDSSGIYKTVADFEQGKLSYAINYKTQSHTINDNLIFNEAEVKVKHEGMSYTLKKSETYGYRDTKGVDFRFVGNKSYQIMSKGQGLIIYAAKEPKSAKGNVSYNTVYYFSKDPASAVQSLTKDNVKSAYPDNHKFHDAIDANFNSDSELASYDSFHKMYKINRLLEASK